MGTFGIFVTIYIHFFVLHDAIAYDFSDAPPDLGASVKLSIKGLGILEKMQHQKDHCQIPWEQIQQLACDQTSMAPWIDAAKKSFAILDSNLQTAYQEYSDDDEKSCIDSYQQIMGGPQTALKTLGAKFSSDPKMSFEEFKTQLLAIQGQFPTNTKEILEVICSEAQPTFVRTSVLDLTIMSGLNAQSSIVNGRLQTSYPDHDLCDGKQPKTGADLVLLDRGLRRLYQWAINTPYDNISMKLRSALHINLYLNNGNVEEYATQKILKDKRSMNCSIPTLPDDLACACAMYQISTHTRNKVKTLEMQNVDRLQRLQEISKQHYLDLVNASELSTQAKAVLADKAKKSFPPLHLSTEFNFNAHYAMSNSGEEEFGVTLGTLMLPDDAIIGIMDHEVGHYFEQSLKDPLIDTSLSNQDLSHLQRFRRCIDKNILDGELEVEQLDGVKREDFTMDVLTLKRGEYLADYFHRQEAMMGKTHMDSMATLLCPEVAEIIDAQILNMAPQLLPHDSSGKAQIADRYATDPHARPHWRMPMLLQGQVPLDGKDYGVDDPKNCERYMFRPGPQ